MIIKLLHKTQRTYLVYAIFIFFIASPIFFLVTEKLYLDEADETLELNKQRFSRQTLPNFKINDIDVWNRYNPEEKITTAIPIKNDSIFNAVLFCELEQENEPYRVLYSPIYIENQAFLYTERINLVESEDLIMSIALLFVALMSLLFIGILIITNRMSKHLWLPFYQLIKQIEGFEIDKNELPKFKESNIEEFNRLNNCVENLISKNIIIYKNQREFIDNAAHELQTPLAIFRGKLDLLIQEKNISKSQAKIIAVLNQNINRLIKLNKNLLILSKVDRHNQLKTEEFSIKELLEKQIYFFKEQAKSKQIIFTLKIDVNFKSIVNANKSLTETLFSNLLLNAIQHNTKNGLIVIEMINNEVIISNTSENNEIPINKLFNRFSKTNQNQQGNGLGLAIVKKIATHHNWKISYSFSNNRHKFSLQF